LKCIAAGSSLIDLLDPRKLVGARIVE
jgi:hypothetical protein